MSAAAYQPGQPDRPAEHGLRFRTTRNTGRSAWSFALMSWLIAIGVVIILGAVTGTTISGRLHLGQGRR